MFKVLLHKLGCLPLLARRLLRQSLSKHELQRWKPK